MIPDSAKKLVKSTRFLHLATSKNDFPHVSLMNYTYYQDDQEDFIIITTPKDTTKFDNIQSNNRVSMLVHDWISDKTTDESREGGRRNSLFELITNLNKNELSSVSVMLNGECTIINKSDEKYKFLRDLHLNNSNIDHQQLDNYVNNDNSELILIKILNCKITDVNDNVQQY